MTTITRYMALGALLGVLAAVIYCSQAEALRIAHPVTPQYVWQTDAVGTQSVADAEDLNPDYVTCMGYGRTPKHGPRLHRRFDCIVTDASNGSWWNVKARMTRSGVSFIDGP